METFSLKNGEITVSGSATPLAAAACRSCSLGVNGGMAVPDVSAQNLPSGHSSERAI